ncbi:MAG: hypothetical protein FJ385_00365 [Verrucomicrobia bacterium]|nr:hypothetical protein [Verrucomicrobiota bacterium]
MRLLPGLCLVLLTASCANRSGDMQVKQFHLRDLSSTDEDPMVRMEKERRLHGAVSVTEQRQRLGQYYTILWDDPSAGSGGEVEVVFEYRQSATGSLVKRQVKRLAPDSARGRVEFAVIGRDYLEGGRVLAWKATVRSQGRPVASRQSYLWD